MKSHSVEEFEFGWESLAFKYQIKTNHWLAKMYDLREYWAKVYLKNTFFAGMTTSGRSESMNSYFDKYVHANTMLNEFVVQYDKALHCRREAEEDEDFKMINSKASLSSQHPIEVRAAE